MSRGWGIGEDTFEFWSWVARQYRIFGEVLEIAQGNGFDIPAIPLPSYPPPPAQNVLPPPPEELTLPVSNVNPLHVLHPPAFYFYTAASCTIERKMRYDSALASEQASGASGLASAPGFANEKTVNHTALIVDLLTKASTLLENEREEDKALALYVAFRMAEVQAAAGEHAAAIKTLNSLAERFEQSAWRPIQAQLRTVWYECAQATGDVETAVRLLADMIAPGDGLPAGEERSQLQDDLLGLLTTTKPSSDDPIELGTTGEVSLLDVHAGFRRAEAPTRSTVPFQVTVSAPAGTDISRLEFLRLRIALTDGSEILVSHGGDSRRVALGAINGTVEANAPLVFSQGEQLVVTGSVSSDAPTELEVAEAVLTLSHNSWVLNWRLDVGRLDAWTAGGASFVPLDGVHSSVSFAPRDHAFSVELDHAPVGFVGEALPITVRVKSSDDRKLKLSLSVLLQPSDEPDGTSLPSYPMLQRS